VTVNGQAYDVEVAPGGAISSISPQGGAAQTAAAPAPAPAAASSLEPVGAPLAGNIFKILVKPGQQVQAGEVLIILEAMKMETEVRSPRAGQVADIAVSEGDTVELGHKLLDLS
jgi:oxaloacetate decarboxylase alpha subunit